MAMAMVKAALWGALPDQTSGLSPDRALAFLVLDFSAFHDIIDMSGNHIKLIWL